MKNYKNRIHNCDKELSMKRFKPVINSVFLTVSAFLIAVSPFLIGFAIAKIAPQGIFNPFVSSTQDNQPVITVQAQITNVRSWTGPRVFVYYTGITSSGTEIVGRFTTFQAIINTSDVGRYFQFTGTLSGLGPPRNMMWIDGINLSFNHDAGQHTTVCLPALSTNHLSLGPNRTILLSSYTDLPVPPLNDPSQTLWLISSDREVANVDDTGRVTGISEGTAIITLTTASGDVVDSVRIEVREDSTVHTPVNTRPPSTTTSSAITVHHLLSRTSQFDHSHTVHDAPHHIHILNINYFNMRVIGWSSTCGSNGSLIGLDGLSFTIPSTVQVGSKVTVHYAPL